MKIIIKDNYGREGPQYDDREVSLTGLSHEQADKIVAVLQDTLSSTYGSDYFVVVDDDYVLRKYMEKEYAEAMAEHMLRVSKIKRPQQERVASLCRHLTEAAASPRIRIGHAIFAAECEIDGKLTPPIIIPNWEAPKERLQELLALAMFYTEHVHKPVDGTVDFSVGMAQYDEAQRKITEEKANESKS